MGIMTLGAIARLQPRAGHPLTQAALLEEVFFKPAQLLVEQIVGLMDQANGDVGRNLRRPSLEELAVNLKGLRDSATKPSDEVRLLRFLFPNRQVAHAQIVAVIVEQFFEARPGDVGEFNLRFL